MKRTIVATMLAVLLMLTMPTAVSAASGIEVRGRTGDGNWTDNTWQVDIFPGEVKSTTLTLENSSSSYLDVEITITPDSLDGGNLTFELDKTDFSMSGGSNEDITLTVRASGSATPGVYKTELTIKSETPPPSVKGGGGVSALKLYDLTVENITENSADILWKTSRSATGELTYWFDSEVTVEGDEYIKEHIVHLENLTDNTVYSFEVTCKDRYGSKKSTSGEFTTLEKEDVPVPEPEPVLPEPEEPIIEPVEPVSEPEPPVLEPVEPIEPVEPEEPIVEEEPFPTALVGGISGGLAIIVLALILWGRRKKSLDITDES